MENYRIEKANQSLRASVIVLVTLIIKSQSLISSRQFANETELELFLKNEYETAASESCTKQLLAQWSWLTDLKNKDKESDAVTADLEAAKTNKEYWEKYFKDLKPTDYNNSEIIKRQLRTLVLPGTATLDEEKLKEILNISNRMTNTYSTAKICPYKTQECNVEKEGLSLEPDIESIMATSKDYEELKYVWTAWRDACGAKIKEDYIKYVPLSNLVAKENSFKDKGEMWRSDYESSKFIEDMDKLWKQVEPLYSELHRYVGKKLKMRYEMIDISDGLIPAHVFGNMWAQSWINLYDLVVPFPNASTVNVTAALKEADYDILKMFTVANEFYLSLGLEDNSMCYDVAEGGAMIEKPIDREVVCHASAWDFCNGKDYRIKMCTEVNYEDFITIHHEMGHIQYDLLYKNQPVTLRTSANPGFHEAVGDTIALSVSTPSHLKDIGLLKDYEDSKEASLNALMSMALERVAFLPFGLLIDKWRWEVYAQNISPEEWNSQWWHYRNTIQKVKAPLDRSNEKDFDPGAKYHVAGDSQYINYFVAHILQFQLYRSLCIAAGEYDPKNKEAVPLHKCDFYQSTKVGDNLRKGLSLGASKHWTEALKAMTGENDLDASALLEYFDPLLTYLRVENNRMTDEQLKEYLTTTYEPAASKITTKLVNAEWNFATDVGNAEKQKEQLEAVLKSAEFNKKYWSEKFQYLDVDHYKDQANTRQLKSLKVLGDAVLEEDELKELTNAGSTMTNIYSTAKICPFKKQDCDLKTEGLSLEPNIEDILATSNDYDELTYVWKAWRDASGAKMRDTYKTYVDLSNKAAKANDFEDKGVMWRSDYESPTFEKDMDKLWDQVKSLYDELHTYVAKKLKKVYKDDLNIEDGLIPAHVLGNMWAQSWINIAHIVKPYPKASTINVTAALIEQKYTVLDMFNKSNDFYTSLGLPTNSMCYDETLGAVITKPTDREILCHASAWDFSDKKDFRIKMCTNVNYEDFITIHHEMGHIQYFIQYKDQPISFRTGANPGFHEAVGDTIALSVATPKHLKKIGLLNNFEESKEADINTLMDMALERVAFLPFGLLIDKWRWDVFAGKVQPDNWNSKWWQYRESIQKVKPPVLRNDATDFDPGAKYHIPGGSQYINYFVAHILEFQLYRSLCIAAGEYDPKNKETVPLHKCDFYQSTKVGDNLRKGLSLGASKHWTEALKAMTGENDLDASALLEYFDPLLTYLRVENNRMTDEQLKEYLTTTYEPAASKITTKLVNAEWNFATDVGNAEKQKEQLEAVLKSAEFNKKYWSEKFQYLDVDHYNDEANTRQLKSLKVLGDAVLEEDELKKLTNAGSTMTNIYSTAKICPFKKQDCDLKTEGLSLEPNIEDILATSNDYDELTYVWKAWRDASGAKMRDTYKTYVDLSNKAAKANDFEDKGDMWRSDYESPTFEKDMDKLWNQVKPLYDELHTYVAKKLKKVYKDDLNIENGLIPAHVLGNMWAQSWINIAHIVKPYPEASTINVTAALMEQKYTVLDMFNKSNDFYTSLGLPTNSMCYDETLGAVITKPTDREILCHASAWDFSDKKDFRIKMCTNVNYEDFITIHHEMGHIQYYIQYKDQPISFRTGANPGFHEAVGDTIALSVATPKHLKKIGLLNNFEESKQADINTLMDMALERVAFLPFGLLIDKWRWDVFAGKVKPEEWNSKWWEYRKSIQKVKPPVSRNDATDFDPGAKYHIPGGSQYINYFVAHILEFQLYRSMCITADEYDPKNKETVPLHKCDFYQSKEVGIKLRNGLSLGASKHWKEALKAMTGEDDLDASALLEYFDPLLTYLRTENNRMTEDELTTFLETNYEPEASKITTMLVNAEWNFATDVANPTMEQEQLQALQEKANFDKEFWMKTFKYINLDYYKTETIRRQIKSLKILGNAALNEEKLSELTNAGNAMTRIYSTAKICPYREQKCNLDTEGLTLEPDIERILATSSNYNELSYVWEAWRDATGVKMKDKYETYVSLSNEAAVANGFKDKGEMWRNDYESDTFIADMNKQWEKVKPLYNELHRYVTKKLKKKFETEFNADDGLIPAHLLGNMWAQSWINIAPLVKPYPDASSVDVTSALIEQKYTVLDMFKKSNEFYMSLGLKTNEMSYDEALGAIITKPNNREILCHASAWDFSNKKDFRIKMCTEVNYEDFITVHHEMGHIQYFIQYKDQPISFRDGANPGFHEAVGDTIALSVATPKHLEKIGLLKNYVDSDEAAINSLMDMALERVAFLPFGLLIDKWRWDVFSGSVPPEKWNSHWWNYRNTIQKVKAPVPRSDIVDFDPGAKYHVPGDSQYINYFVARILQFQLYRSLCKVAGEYRPIISKVPLHKCDFYKSTKAGSKLRDGLSLGKSKHWKEVLKVMTGEEDLDASALLEYFEPLYQYLKNQNGPLVEPVELRNFLRIDYEPSASVSHYEQVVAEWNFVTDVNNPSKEDAQVEATLRLGEFTKLYWENYFKDLKEGDYTDEILSRQVRSLKYLGNAALDSEKLKEFTNNANEMTAIYSTAKICPYDNQKCDISTKGLSLEPGIRRTAKGEPSVIRDVCAYIERIMATSTNYKELEYVWTSWRKASGANIKSQYKKYVQLSNEAAIINGFQDKGDMWRSQYESPKFIDDMDNLWKQVKPLYDELHKFVAKKLKEKYGDALDISDNLIPAHLLGNMWAQTWSNLAPLVKPYPNADEIDVTSALKNKGYTPLKMFQTSDEFYISLGLEPNDMSYDVNRGAIIEKPSNKEILCHASAWDFSNGKDFRIKMCTNVDYEDFKTVHHEMGHIQYFIQYKNQPLAFRDSANPGFHEAIGDTIVLSMATPKHLNKIELLDEYKDTQESSINALMDMALEKVAFLPFGLLIDKWRWDVFSGKVSPDNWNSHWWMYRETLQKIKAPVPRSDERDFDPGAKYHVPGDSQYINYFVARILQFQLYRALCIAANEYDPSNKNVPLHKCDFYKSKEAGDKLRAGLSLGSSKHWKDVLEIMTGEKNLDASALLEYFEPLMAYLKEQNASDKKPERGIHQTVPIVVGTVLGVCLIAGLAFYGYFRYRNNKSGVTNKA